MSRRIGRYTLHDAIARGGMGTVHLATLQGEDSRFSRIVAAKVLHPHLAHDTALRDMLVDEARIVAAIRHANVATTLDVVVDQEEVVLVMEFVDGLPLSTLMTRAKKRSVVVPVGVAVALLCDVLEGLHAAHEAKRDDVPLGIVHRDVSPHNVIVGFDGTARVIDFGVAKAVGRSQATSPGEVKGKAGYMAPEQALGRALDRRVDVYAAGVVLWELLALDRLFAGETQAETMLKHVTEVPRSIRDTRLDVSEELDAILQSALAKDATLRWATALEMASALRRSAALASPAEVVAWMDGACADLREERRALLADLERSSTSLRPKSKAASVVPPGAGPSRRGRGVRIFAGAAMLATGLAVVGALRSRPSSSGVVVGAPEARPVPPTSPPPSVAAPEPTPRVDAREPSAAPSASTQKRASTPRAAGHVPRGTASTSASSPPPTVIPTKRCCSSDGLRLRFTDCEDNCPP